MSKTIASWRSIYNNIRESRLKRIALSACIALVAFWLQMLLIPDGQDDDWAMALYLSGVYPESGYTLFINSALGGIVSSIYMALPWGPNYHLILEISLSAIAFMTVMYYSLGHLPTSAFAALTSAFLLFAVSLCTHALNFTGVTCMLLSAGLLLVFVQLFERRISPLPTIAGIVFIILAFLLRMTAVLLCLPFALCLVAYAFAANRTEPRKTALLCVPLCIACAICACFAVYDQAQWQQAEWNDWAQTNTYRSELSDYPIKPYEEIATQLEEIGVSSNDYWLTRNWATNDSGFFTPEKLREIAEIARVETHITPIGMARGALQYWGHLVFHPYILLSLIAVLAIMVPRFRRSPLKAKVAAGIVAVIALITLSYFRMTGRLPIRVEYPIWLYCFTACALLLWSPKIEVCSGSNAGDAKVGLASAMGVLISIVLIATAYCPAISLPNRSGIDAILHGKNESVSELITYQKKHPNCTFAYSVDAAQARESFYCKRALPSKESALTMQSLGGWSAGCPFLAKQLKTQVGKDVGLFEAFAVDRDVMLVTTRQAYADHVLAYIREHYNSGAEAALITEIHDSAMNVDFKVYAFAQ